MGLVFVYVKCLCVWPVIINCFGICLCQMFVCVWPVIINGLVSVYVKCLCVRPVIINGFGICCMLNVCVCGQ